jgi:hypothetical protein
MFLQNQDIPAEIKMGSANTCHEVSAGKTRQEKRVISLQ